MNENLNLVEILKDCPKGTKLYSTIYGEVELEEIDEELNYPISFITNDEYEASVALDGRHTTHFNGECTLFPSKKERSWSKFKVKKPKFNPQTLQAFDRVLVRDKHEEKWNCNFFSHISYDCVYYPYIAINTGYTYCIPYNEDTKHLVGTTEDAPEFYKYWEDCKAIKSINPKNTVHFYVARDKDGSLWLYIGKPVRELYVFKNDKHSITLVSSEDFSQYGLNERDYDYLKWEDEPVEVFINMED